MTRSKLKKSLNKRELLFGGWISYDHPSIAETFALTGFDFISIDMEHAPISLSSAQRIISISQAYQIPCLPRPVSHSNDFFKPLLDSGADGLIVECHPEPNKSISDPAQAIDYKTLKNIYRNIN